MINNMDTIAVCFMRVYEREKERANRFSPIDSADACAEKNNLINHAFTSHHPGRVHS